MKKKGLIVALDVKTPKEAKALVKRLGRHVDFYKVAPSLVFQDPGILKWLKGRRKKIFLDFKWYDIPSQVRRSVEMAGRMGITACTIHLSAGTAVMKAVLQAKPRPQVWGVSVLTSFGEKDLREVGVSSKVPQQVERLARLAHKAGLDGMVCSVQELALLKKKKWKLQFVTPGIQWGKTVGQDQTRVASPAEAWSRGADYIVVGRAILKAKDPVQVTKDILSSY